MTKEQSRKREELSNRYRALKARLIFIGVVVTAPNIPLASEEDLNLWNEAIRNFFELFGKWMVEVEKFYGEVRKNGQK